jgi:hypothetical protein
MIFSTAPRHADHKNLTLIIGDMHGEYPLKSSTDPWVRVTQIWENYVVSNESTLMAEAYKLFVDAICMEARGRTIDLDTDPSYYNHWLDRDHSTWSVFKLDASSPADMHAYLLNYLESIGGPEGGDDDTYDYWPTAMGICCDIARDLHEIDPTLDSFKAVCTHWDNISAVYAECEDNLTQSEFANEIFPRPTL